MVSPKIVRFTGGNDQIAQFSWSYTERWSLYHSRENCNPVRFYKWVTTQKNRSTKCTPRFAVNFNLKFQLSMSEYTTVKSRLKISLGSFCFKSKKSWYKKFVKFISEVKVKVNSRNLLKESMLWLIDKFTFGVYQITQFDIPYSRGLNLF